MCQGTWLGEPVARTAQAGTGRQAGAGAGQDAELTAHSTGHSTAHNELCLLGVLLRHLLGLHCPRVLAAAARGGAGAPSKQQTAVRGEGMLSQPPCHTTPLTSKTLKLPI